MKKAISLIMKKFLNDKLVFERKKLICAYCESAEIYQIKKQNVIYCRKCGEKSKLKGDEDEK